jgi:molybdopterin/thiamine biosynthesis adenylyltransferase
MTRAEAHQEAVKTLEGLGFTEESGIWRGKIHPTSLPGIDVRVRLPFRFPQQLPNIAVETLNQIPRQMAHVQPDRFICVAPTTGVLINALDPRGLINGVLERATRIIERGMSGASDPELYAEFLSYWGWGCGKRIGSIAKLQASGRATLCFLKTPNPTQPCNGILTTSFEDAKVWAKNLGSSIISTVPAYLLALSGGIRPPRALDELFLVKEVLSELQERVSAEDWKSFEKWLRTVVLPATVAFSFVLPDNLGSVLAAIILPNKSGGSAGGGNYLYRSKQSRAIADLPRIPEVPVERVQVDRYDAGFLIPRAGGDVNLLSRACAIIGVGAIGSHVADLLATLGFGNLTLIDGQILTNENVHRHVLGMVDINKLKATTMVQRLQNKFPHLDFKAVPTDVEEQLDKDGTFLKQFDLIVNATGDETLGLELNELLHLHQNQIHTWLDPLGIGGHVLYVHPAPARGCFRCLFKVDPQEGLYNAASFAKHGQDFTRSFSGCGGVFTPFSDLDSVRTAVETAKLCVRVVTAKVLTSALLSWRGPEDEFVRAGFQLSPRAASVDVGCVLETPDFIDQSCPVCGAKS